MRVEIYEKEKRRLIKEIRKVVRNMINNNEQEISLVTWVTIESIMIEVNRLIQQYAHTILPGEGLSLHYKRQPLKDTIRIEILYELVILYPKQVVDFLYKLNREKI